MNTKYTINQRPIIIGLVILVLILFPLGFILDIFWFSQFDANTKGVNHYDRIQTVVQIIVGVLNIITIAFLVINYSQVKEQNEMNNEDNAFTRNIELIYKQTDIINKIINENETLRQMQADILDTASLVKHIKDFAPLEKSLNRIEENILILKLIIYNSNVSIKRMNYLIKISEYNIGTSFFSNLEILKKPAFETTNGYVTGIAGLITYILEIKKKVTNENVKDLIKAGEYLSGNSN